MSANITRQFSHIKKQIDYELDSEYKKKIILFNKSISDKHKCTTHYQKANSKREIYQMKHSV